MEKACEIFNKRPRLKSFSYRGRYRYFLTLCTHNRISYFTEDRAVEHLIRILKEASDRLQFKIWAYCFMPDHLHLLAEGISAESDLKRFVSSFKQQTGYAVSADSLPISASSNNPHEATRKLCQPSHYDHVLRKDEDLLEVARYIFENPVRKKLVGNIRDYPFSGSLVLRMNEFGNG